MIKWFMDKILIILGMFIGMMIVYSLCEVIKFVIDLVIYGFKYIFFGI